MPRPAGAVRPEVRLELLDEASTTKLIEAAANKLTHNASAAPGLVSLQLQVRMHGEHAKHKEV